MPGPLRPTAALFPAMGLVLALSFFLSSRTPRADGLVVDRVFPALRLVHPPGVGTFVPGSFALNFFLTSFAVMVLLNAVRRGWFVPLKSKGANVFYYVFFVVIAICEVAADLWIPLLPLPGRWDFGAAVALVHAAFLGAAALAAAVSVGAEKEW